MNCQEIKELWDLYHDGELDSTRLEVVRHHLKMCPDCEGFYRGQDRIEHALGSALKKGTCSKAIWQSEQEIIRIMMDESSSKANPLTSGCKEAGETAISFWRACFGLGPRYYAVLATIWIVLFIANYYLSSHAMENLPIRYGPSMDAKSAAFFPYCQELLLELATMDAVEEEKPAPVQPPRSKGPSPAQNDALIRSHPWLSPVGACPWISFDKDRKMIS